MSTVCSLSKSYDEIEVILTGSKVIKFYYRISFPGKKNRSRLWIYLSTAAFISSSLISLISFFSFSVGSESCF